MDISTEEELLLQRQEELTRRAAVLLVGEELEILRNIFTELRQIRRQMRQLRMARRVMARRAAEEANQFIRALREETGEEAFSTQRLLAAAGVSKLDRMEAKLVESESESESDSDEEEGFTEWVEELRLQRRKQPSVRELERRLQALKQSTP